MGIKMGNSYNEFNEFRNKMHAFGINVYEMINEPAAEIITKDYVKEDLKDFLKLIKIRNEWIQNHPDNE